MVNPSGSPAVHDPEDASLFEIVIRETYRDFDAMVGAAYFRRFGEPHKEEPESEHQVPQGEAVKSKRRNQEPADTAE